jgi:ATP-dependent DNA helicase RecQ
VPVSLIDIAPRANLREVSGTPRARRERSTLPDADDSFEQADPETVERFERLRSARVRMARERQLPAFCICSDRTLRQIARHAPADLQTLEQVKGMGPMKVKMYGEALLAALREN